MGINAIMSRLVDIIVVISLQAPSPRAPLPKAFSEPSCEPSCEEKGSFEASCEPSHDNYFHMKVNVKLQMNLFLHMKVHVKVHLEALPNGTSCSYDRSALPIGACLWPKTVLTTFYIGITTD